jgi:hypothetical protein
MMFVVWKAESTIVQLNSCFKIMLMFLYMYFSVWQKATFLGFKSLQFLIFLIVLLKGHVKHMYMVYVYVIEISSS